MERKHEGAILAYRPRAAQTTQVCDIEDAGPVVLNPVQSKATKYWGWGGGGVKEPSLQEVASS